MTGLVDDVERPLDHRAMSLAEVPMLAGMSDEDLLDLASVLTSLELSENEVLWWQATEVDGLHILLDGELRMDRRLPGEREFEVNRVGPGTVAGGILLLGGGIRVATARAASPARLLFLHRDDFRARMQLGRPSALSLKRRILENTCARVRSDHAFIAAALDPAGVRVPRDAAPGRCVPCHRSTVMPPQSFAARLPFFRGMPPAIVAALLAAGQALEVDRDCVVLEEGQTTDRCYVVLNGAVEDVVRRDERTVRVRFAGPGRACCYLGYFDGKPATVRSVARERTVLLAVDVDDFHAWMAGRDELSRAFTAAVEADLMATLQGTASPKAHLATEGTS